MTLDRETINDLEQLLCTKLRPTFIAVSQPDLDDSTIEVIVSCSQFNYKDIDKRVSIVFRLLEYYMSDILEERLIIVSAFNNSEMDEILEDVFKRERE